MFVTQGLHFNQFTPFSVWLSVENGSNVMKTENHTDLNNLYRDAHEEGSEQQLVFLEVVGDFSLVPQNEEPCAKLIDSVVILEDDIHEETEMDGRFKFNIKECRVNIKKDVPRSLGDPIYSIMSDMTVVGDVIDTVIRIEKNKNREEDEEGRGSRIEFAKIGMEFRNAHVLCRHAPPNAHSYTDYRHARKGK